MPAVNPLFIEASVLLMTERNPSAKLLTFTPAPPEGSAYGRLDGYSILTGGFSTENMSLILSSNTSLPISFKTMPSLVSMSFLPASPRASEGCSVTGGFGGIFFYSVFGTKSALFLRSRVI